MRMTVTEPGQQPYDCTMPVESIPFLIRNGCLVVPLSGCASAEYARYRNLVNGFARDAAPSHGRLIAMEAQS